MEQLKNLCRREIELNYNDRNPTFSFRLNHLLNQRLTKMAKLYKESTNELARTILTKYLKGELVEKKADDKQERLMELRIKKLEAEIKYLEIKNNFADNFHAPLSRSATVHIKPEIIVENNNPTQEIQQSPYDAKNRRIQCTECGVLFFWRTNSSEMKWVIDQYKQHLLVKHGRNMTAFESDVINNLEFEGASL